MTGGLHKIYPGSMWGVGMILSCVSSPINLNCTNKQTHKNFALFSFGVRLSMVLIHFFSPWANYKNTHCTSVCTLPPYKNLVSFYIYFRSLFAIWKSIKWLTTPSKKVDLFSVRSQRSLIKLIVLQYSLVYKEDGFLAQYLCNKCHAKGNFKSRCHKDGVKVELQEKKDMVCSVKMTLVVKKFPNKATLQGGWRRLIFLG